MAASQILKCLQMSEYGYLDKKYNIKRGLKGGSIALTWSLYIFSIQGSYQEYPQDVLVHLVRLKNFIISLDKLLKFVALKDYYFRCSRFGLD